MKIPAATYRLQLTPEFGFHQAGEVLPYLRELGITDIYASPIFHARAGSRHGYDVVDPNRLNPELGTEQEFAALNDQAQRLGFGWIQDIVPNHMAYDGQNRLLMDVLENGEASPYFDFFDIDWQHPYESMRAKVLAPFLGGFYGECLEKGEIALYYGQHGLGIRYFSLQLPVNFESYSEVLTQNLALLRKRLGAHHLDFIKFLGVLYALKNIPPKEESADRADQIRFVKRMLWELYTGTPEIKAHLDANIATFNGTPGHPESFNLLDRLLSQQHYRLSFWKVAAEELDYRRFFNINELISVRVEDEKVFQHSHELIFKLLRDGRFSGLRVDHVDGLYDPLGYLTRLRREADDAYLTVEKILGADEELPEFWAVEGTTGYDYLNIVNGIFCARQHGRKFSRIYARFTGLETSARTLITEKKRLIIGKYMAGDIENLAFLLKRVSSRDRHAADVTLYGLKRALVEVLAFFPVYRSYVGPGLFSPQDRQKLAMAVRQAKDANAGLLLELNYIERFLLLDFADHVTEEEKSRWTDFVMRFQQLSGPLMAKGSEDTAVYVYNRLLSLNEVGGDLDRFGVSMEEFHDFNRRRRARWPHAMNATATHDTKRGEDARARINALSELPAEWEKNLRTWTKINRGKKTKVRSLEAPNRNNEYFLYQTLIGAYPIPEGPDAGFINRLTAYLIKAVREAKVHTEWLKPDEAYEQAFADFAQKILAPGEGNHFIEEFFPFAKKIAYCGMFNSLAQLLLKIASPGVADIYQGTELWDLSFVDPDNRRPVDYAKRRRWLEDFKTAEEKDRLSLLGHLLSSWEDGRIKLYLMHKLLEFRRAHQELFSEGDYIPLEATGELKSAVCAFARRRGQIWALAVAPRLIGRMVYYGTTPLGAEAWGAAALSLGADMPSRWLDIISGERLETADSAPRKHLPLAGIFNHFPVALLYHEETLAESQLAEEGVHADSFQHDA
ncbi:MAG TPA: malto-oligosyltrehalose synthase [Candidatus Binatia bacterium]